MWDGCWRVLRKVQTSFVGQSEDSFRWTDAVTDSAFVLCSVRVCFSSGEVGTPTRGDTMWDEFWRTVQQPQNADLW